MWQRKPRYLDLLWVEDVNGENVKEWIIGETEISTEDQQEDAGGGVLLSFLWL